MRMGGHLASLAVAVGAASCGGGQMAGADRVPTSLGATRAAANGPAAGTVLVDGGDPAATIITNGNGFDALDPNSAAAGRGAPAITTYAASGQRLAQLRGRFTFACGAADVTVADGRRLIIVERTSNGTSSVDLKAWDAHTGRSAWTAARVDAGSAQRPCSGVPAELANFASTGDGRWGIYGGTGIVNLESGAVRHSSTPLAVVGDYAVAVAATNRPGSLAPHGVVDPGDGSQAGSIPGPVFDSARALAPTGTRGVGVRAAAATLSSDYTRLISTVGRPPRIVAYSLPGGRVAWTMTPKVPVGIEADVGGVLIVGRASGGSPGELAGLDDRTGRQLWEMPGDSICGVTPSQILISNGGTLTLADTLTGRRLPYAGSRCPRNLLAGGIEYEFEPAGPDFPNGGLRVTQTLAP